MNKESKLIYFIFIACVVGSVVVFKQKKNRPNPSDASIVLKSEEPTTTRTQVLSVQSLSPESVSVQKTGTVVHRFTRLKARPAKSLHSRVHHRAKYRSASR